MKNVLIGTLSFGLFAVAPSLLLSISAFMSSPKPRENPWDDFLFMGYYFGVSTGFTVVGFLLATAFSGPWRRGRTLRATVIASLLGLTSPIVHYATLALTAPLVLPLFRSATWYAIVITYGLPGLVLGAAAHVLLKLTGRPRPQPA